MASFASPAQPCPGQRAPNLTPAAEQHLSLALSTAQIGKLFCLGIKANGQRVVFERSFNRWVGCLNGVAFLSVDALLGSSRPHHNKTFSVAIVVHP